MSRVILLDLLLTLLVACASPSYQGPEPTFAPFNLDACWQDNKQVVMSSNRMYLWMEERYHVLEVKTIAESNTVLITYCER